MKKIFFVISISCFALFIISCKKQNNEPVINSQSSFIKKDNPVWVNPFDESNSGITTAFDIYYTELGNMENPSLEQAIVLLNNIISENYYYNTEFQLNSPELITIFNDVCVSALSKTNIDIEHFKQMEYSIYSDNNLSSNEKDRLLYNLSAMRIIATSVWAGTFEEKHRQCIIDQLNAIYANPVSVAAYIADWPWGFFWIVGECFYAVGAGQNQ